MNEILERLKDKFKNKKVLIVGLGLQGGGVGLAEFFAKLGARVKVTDLKTKEVLKPSINRLKDYAIEYSIGRHELDDFLTADLIFKGPSVPWTLPELVASEQKGIPIEMESSFFAANCQAKIIGITGSRGKSTTTQMIYQCFKNSGLTVHLAGNIPQISTINLLSQVKPEDWVVMELSSWQLSGFHRQKISPHIGVFTNFSPDHLNLYKSIDDYLYDKKAIYLYQGEGDYLVVNINLKETIEKDKPQSQVVYFHSDTFNRQQIHLKGIHNRENAAAALAIVRILKLDEKKCLEILINFSSLPYREEIVGQKDNVIFVNDTTSTTPTALMKAIETFSDKPIYLLFGGTSKRLPYSDLINYLGRVEKIILLKGNFTEEILPLLKTHFPDKITPVHDDLEKAVLTAFNLAKGNNQISSYVLLSPGATSFDMFNNEFHRGDVFNQIVHNIVA